jgi:hypothetical protein
MSRPQPEEPLGIRSFNFLKRHFWYFTLPVLIFQFIYWFPNLATNLVNGVATTITRFLAGLLPAAGSLLFASHGKHLLRLTDEELSAASGLIGLGFFHKHPEYAWLERHINESNTPDLFDCLTLAERMRLQLVGLFDFMLRNAFSMGDAEQLVGPERR